MRTLPSWASAKAQTASVPLTIASAAIFLFIRIAPPFNNPLAWCFAFVQTAYHANRVARWPPGLALPEALPGSRAARRPFCCSATSAGSGEGYPREPSLANLQHDRVAPFHGKPLVGDFFPVDAHAPLLNHAQGLRGAGDQVGLLQHLHDRHFGGRARARLSTVDRA